VAWSSAFVAIRAVHDDFEPGVLALGRLAIGTAALGAALLLRRRWVHPTGREWALVAICGVVRALQRRAERRRGTPGRGDHGDARQRRPVLIALLARALLGEGFPRWLLIGTAGAFTGVVLIGATITHIAGSDGTGVLLCLPAAVAWAVGVTAQKPVLRRLPARQVTAMACPIGALAAAPVVGQLATVAGSASAGALAAVVYQPATMSLAPTVRQASGVLTADSLARFAAVLADRSRAGMCLALLDQRAWTAGELARHVGVAPSTASEHLSVLVSAGLLAEERQGRHRYVRLADAETAQLVEDLAAAIDIPDRPSSLRSVRAAGQLAAARTCYDHLAGALGVGLFDALVHGELITTSNGLALTDAGRSWFADLAGVDALHPRGRRPLIRTCLDWTERRSHLGGTLGAALCHQLRQRAWITTTPRHRAVTLTPEGALALTDRLGLDLHALHPQPPAAATAGGCV